MKRLVILLTLLFVLFEALQFGINYYGSGKESIYSINDINIKEVFTQNRKNEVDNYYIEIDTNDTKFSIQLFDNFKHSTRIIKKIEHFKDNKYECILPVFKNDEIYTDVICKSDYFYNYRDIIGLDNELDNFVNSLDVYDVDRFKENIEYKEKDNYKFYLNNLDNNFLAFDQYRGIILFSDLVFEYIPLFNKDVYKRPISTVVNNYYVVADYNEDYDFHKFYMINLENGSIKEIFSDESISFDSYIQGVVDSEIYLIDKSNKKQYEINVKTKTVIEIGNENTGIKIYKNFEWSKGNIYEAINNDILFNDYSVDNNLDGVSYDRIDKVGNELSGYYYLYKKDNDIYRIYRASIQNTKNITYLFNTDNVNHIYYKNNVIYYKEQNKYKYYKEGYGIKTIAVGNEFEFNDNLNLYLYTK